MLEPGSTAEIPPHTLGGAGIFQVGLPKAARKPLEHLAVGHPLWIGGPGASEASAMPDNTLTGGPVDAARALAANSPRN